MAALEACAIASGDCTAQPFPLPGSQGSIVLHEVTGRSLDPLLRELARLSAPRDRNNKFGSPRFPGPFPVSLEKASLEGQLRPAAAAAEVEMWVAEKTDGVRVCLVACTLGCTKLCVIFTRKLSCHLLPLKRVSNVGFQGTVLDGELTRNKATGRVELLVFDAVVAGGCAVHQRPFSGRVQAAKHILGSCEAMQGDPVDLRMKSFLPFNRAMISNLRPLLAEASAKYSVDGIVFVPERLNVVYGRNERLLKHKMHHTIDFALLEDGQLAVYDADQRALRPVGKLVEDGRSGGRNFAPGSILECELVESGWWRCVAVRTDKSSANNSVTFQRTLGNILENLTLEHVEAVCL